MTINLQQVINSSAGVRLASLLGQVLPVRLGYTLGSLIAWGIAQRANSGIVRAVRANQWVVRGENISAQELDLAVREVFRHAARVTFDLYHHIHNPISARHIIHPDEITCNLLTRPEFDQHGLVVVGLHLSGFDLVLQSLVAQGMKPLVLTISNPQGGRKLEYDIRKRTGMNLLPASLKTIRMALQHLEKGGFVATGIDRPLPDPRHYPKFFGRPAPLPTHHIFLASKAQVPVIVMVPRWLPDGTYQVLTSEPIEMDRYPDREMGAILNAQKVLSIAEGYIRQSPEQWLMTIPVWPDVEIS